MTRSSLLLVLLFAGLCWGEDTTSTTLLLDKDWADSNFRPYFYSHDEYYAIPLPHAPVAFLRNELNKRYKIDLLSTGEAHLTVLSPSDWRILGQRVTMPEVEQLALKQRAHVAKIETLCLGQVVSEVKGKKNTTWVLKVDSPELRQFRRYIWRIYVTKNGSGEDFDWESWNPSVTVGYTDKQLYDEDLTARETFECLIPVKLKP